MLDVESLISALSDDSPSGPDPEYDAAFLQLEQAAAGKPERQFRNEQKDVIIPAEPPDWRTVRELGLELAGRTRDLRVAVWLARCGARLEGVSGAYEGLALVAGLLDSRWADVHPQLDASDNDDPTMRLNALAPLASTTSMLGDLRAAALTGARGSVTVREIELGLGLAEPLPEEVMPSEAGVRDALRAAAEQESSLPDTLRRGREAIDRILCILDEKVEVTAAPDLMPLARLVRALDSACTAETGTVAESQPDDTGAVVASPAPIQGVSVAQGAIATRGDVVRTIDKLCEWIERNEPSNPAPLFLRRGQRLMTMSFVDIVKDLMPDGLDQLEKLAGIGTRSE